jgi:hypothetical protein
MICALIGLLFLCYLSGASVVFLTLLIAYLRSDDPAERRDALHASLIYAGGWPYWYVAYKVKGDS